MNKKQGEKELIKTALYSEAWAYKNLYETSILFNDKKLEAQALDELRHVRQLQKLSGLGVAETATTQGILPYLDSTYGMQNVFYESVCGIVLPRPDITEDMEFFFAFHEVMERRAIWIYKTLILSTNNENTKNVLRQILKDEAGHINSIPKTDNVRVNNLIAADNWLFKKHLPKYYNNMKLTECEKFWRDYWANNIVRADGKQFNNEKGTRI